MSFQRKLRKLAVKGTNKLRRIKEFALHKDPVDAILSEVRTAKPEPQLQDRVVVITGSSSGIGHVLAAAHVQTLVTAMAALTPPALGQTTLSSAQHTALDSVIAASWS